VEPDHPEVSIRRQCELLGVSRSSYYFEPAGETDQNLSLMRIIDEQYLKRPTFGYGMMTDWLILQGHSVNYKRIRRLMRLAGLAAVFPGKKTTERHPGHKVYPYLLRGVVITRTNHVWSTDITYVPLARGFVFLVAVIDWYSRCVLSWRLSNTMDMSFCIEALEDAFQFGKPEIFNTDQGSQFTSPEFTQRLLSRNIAVSMDGRGRALDNVFIERLWRSVKYENIYLMNYETVADVYDGLTSYFTHYNHDRPHQAHNGQTPGSVFFKSPGAH
jgi:putative transposase